MLEIVVATAALLILLTVVGFLSEKYSPLVVLGGLLLLIMIL